MHAPGLFDSSDHLAGLSATGDPLEALDGTVDLEVSCPVLIEAPGYAERLTGALLDRLTHHVHILEMNGDSYRLKQGTQPHDA